MPGNTSQQPIVCTARCEDCGARIGNIPWRPGTPCPRCGSGHFTPVPIIRRGSDYDEADRSQGFAIEDIRLGRLAVWAGYINAKRLQQTLHEQRQLAMGGGSAPDLGALLVKQGAMTRNQTKAILGVMNAVPGNQADEEFARGAVQNRFARREQVAACQARQQEIVQTGRDAPPLALLMHEKRELQENQVLALITASEKRERGILYRIHQAEARLNRAKLARLLVNSPLRAVDPRLVAVLGVVLIAGIVFLPMAWHTPTTAATECTNCGALGGAPADSKWPIVCSECGMGTVYPRSICERCGKMFPTTGAGYGVACPQCGSTDHVLVTNKTDLDEINARITAEKQRRGGRQKP